MTNDRPMHTRTAPQTIAVIGGGASGTLTAAHLLRAATGPLSVVLVDQTAAFGQGIAYGTTEPCHLLNIPAGSMSAWPDQPNHFVDWLQSHAHRLPPWITIAADTFLPRYLYARYLRDVLVTTERYAVPGVRLDCITDEAIAIRPHEDGACVVLRNRRTVVAQHVVLALGYLPPTDPPVADRSFYCSPRYRRDLWSGCTSEMVNPDAAVLLIGTGLTMVDAATTLWGNGHTGTIYAVSRRGVAPLVHRPSDAYPIALDPNHAPQTARTLLRHIRAEVRRAAEQGYDWRGVVDAFRPLTTALWRSLPAAEQRRFLRHLHPYWDTHRHRTAPQIGTIIDQMRASGQLVISAGRIRAFKEDTDGVDVTIQQRAQSHDSALRVSAVINCTGARIDYRSNRPDLIADLEAHGLAQPDQRGLGLECAANGALTDAAGHTSSSISVIGPLRRGAIWETTAIPEIRDQASTYASLLLHDR